MCCDGLILIIKIDLLLLELEMYLLLIDKKILFLFILNMTINHNFTYKCFLNHN